METKSRECHAAGRSAGMPLRNATERRPPAGSDWDVAFGGCGHLPEPLPIKPADVAVGGQACWGLSLGQIRV